MDDLSPRDDPVHDDLKISQDFVFLSMVEKLSETKLKKLSRPNDSFLKRFIRDPYDITCSEEFRALQDAAKQYHRYGQTSWLAKSILSGDSREQTIVLPENTFSYKSPLVRFQVQVTFEDEREVGVGEFSIFITRENVEKAYTFSQSNTCKVALTSVQSLGRDSDASITKSFTIKATNTRPDGSTINVLVIATALHISSDIFFQRFVIIPALTGLLYKLMHDSITNARARELLLNESPYTLMIPSFEKCSLSQVLPWLSTQMTTEKTPLVSRALGFQTEIDVRKTVPELQTFLVWTYWCNLYFMKRNITMRRLGFKRNIAQVDVDTVALELQKNITWYFFKLKILQITFTMPEETSPVEHTGDKEDIDWLNLTSRNTYDIYGNLASNHYGSLASALGISDMSSIGEIKVPINTTIDTETDWETDWDTILSSH